MSSIDEALTRSIWVEPSRGRRAGQRQPIGRTVRQLLTAGYDQSALVLFVRPEPGRDIKAKFGLPNHAFSSRPPYFAPGRIEASGKLWFREQPVDAKVDVRMLDARGIVDVFSPDDSAAPPAYDAAAAERQLYYRLKLRVFDELVNGTSCGLCAASPVSGALALPTRLSVFGAVKLGETVLKAAYDVRLGNAQLAANSVYRNYRAAAKLALNDTKLSVKNVAVSYVGEIKGGPMPARYEISVQGDGSRVLFAYVHQMLWHNRQVVLGGQFSQDVDVTSTGLKWPNGDKRGQALMTVGGSWQLARQTFVKAKIDSSGGFTAAWAMRLGQDSVPSVTLKMSADTKLYNPVDELNVGASIEIEQL